jgi:CHAT domain-containing protein/tetratricopeptide (TPR) repeat protein
VATRADRLGAIASPLWVTCDALEQAEHRDEIIALCRSRLAVTGETAASDSLELATLSYWISRELYHQGLWHLKECLDLASRAHSILSSRLGPEDPHTAASATVLGVILEARGDYETARQLYDQSLAVCRRVLAPEDPQIAECLIAVANLRTRLAEYDGVDSLYQRAMTIREKAFGPRHPKVASALGNFAIYLKSTGQYARAQEAYETVLAIQQAAHGREHPSVARAWHNLGSLLLSSSQLTASESAARQSVEIAIRVHGPEHLTVATYRLGLAAVLTRRHDLLAARAEAEEALRVREATLGADHPQVTFALGLLASIQAALGDFDRAEPLMTRTFERTERELGPNHPRVAELLMELGGVRAAHGDLDGATRHMERALRIRETVFGPDQLVVAYTLSALADLRLRAGDLAAAGRLAERSIAVQRGILGPDRLRSALPFIVLAECRRRTGGTAEAERLLENARQAIAAASRERHPINDGLLRSRCRLLLDTGRTEDALNLSIDWLSRQRELVRSIVHGLPERQALRYLSELMPARDVPLSVLAERPELRARTESVWKALIRSRALVLDEMALRGRAVAAAPAADTLEQRLREEWSELTRDLAWMLVSSPDSGEADAAANRFLELRERQEKVESRLALEYGEVHRDRDLENASPHTLLASLPSGSALVSYFLYRQLPTRIANAAIGSAPAEKPADDAGIPSYAALVVAPDGELAPAIGLGKADDIELRIARWRDEAGLGPRITGRSPLEAEWHYREAGARLREAIWDPIARLLEGATYVFVVPDGELCLVDFAALPDGRSGYLADKDFHIHTATAERDLILDSTGRAAGRGLLAIGAPDFDTSPGPAVGEGPRQEAASGRESPVMPETLSLEFPPTRDGALPNCEEFSRVTFAPLPGAAREIDDLIALWRDADACSSDAVTRRAGAVTGRAGAGEPGRATEKGEDPVLRLVGRDAREEMFKQLAPGRRVLHVASHGFFLGAGCGVSSRGMRGVGGMASAARPEALAATREHPLLLSGLALAGANVRYRCAAGEDDGILTAAEIATLDLSGSDWVVLSACASGLGETWAGEGVLGLRRAFQIAGAGTVIMSLWSVEDEIARAWMDALYRARRLAGCWTPDAVHQANRRLLDRRRAAGESTHPYYWAGFIASGDWR